MKLPNVDAGFFGAAMKLQDTLARVPLPAAEYQAAISSLRGMVEHAETLTGRLEELSKAPQVVPPESKG